MLTNTSIDWSICEKDRITILHIDLQILIFKKTVVKCTNRISLSSNSEWFA